MSELANQKNKSFRNILKKIGPNTDPCDTEEQKLQSCCKNFLFSFFACFIFLVSTEENHCIKTKR